MKKISVGETISKRKLMTIETGQAQIPDSEYLIHLQFRRYAGCPFCSMHLRSIVQRHDEIVAAGIREVVVFRSTVTELQHYHADMPFAIIADPKERLYTEFGIESELRAVLNPRALWAGMRNIVLMLPKLPRIPPKGEGILGLPADFLIATDGRVVACKYGVHAYDQWSVDELLSFARQHITSGSAIVH
jgi:peroxiredoxin